MPRFSIVIPTYNCEKYLEACLDSVANQSFDDWEGVIVDDASPDACPKIADEHTKKDKRFKVVHRKENGGLHLARKSGVEAATGDFILFLDSDDELAPDTLERLDKVVPDSPNTILHFGLRCIERCGVSDEAARGFEQWANSTAPRLDRGKLLHEVYSVPAPQGKDWNVDHRLFSSKHIKHAFSLMTDKRLERAEDSYEFLILASISDGEITHDDIEGYLYNYGYGVSSASELDCESFENSAKRIMANSDEASLYASKTEDRACIQAAEALRARLSESVANEWRERVAPADKLQAVRIMRDYTGANACSEALMRFVRDEVYAVWDKGGSIKGDEPFLNWYGYAVDISACDGGPSKEYASYYTEVRRLFSYIENRRREQERAPLREESARSNIRVFVSTHKDVDLFDSKILQPVQVGCALRPDRFPWAHHDDEGDNISKLNAQYCELTTQYWAWKNVDADYYGFCHYRRYFDFSDERHEENDWGEVMDCAIGSMAQTRYALDDESISKAVEGCDIITTEFKQLSDFPGDTATPLAQWQAAPALHNEDLSRCIEILKEMHPDYAQDADEFLEGGKACFCNMFIMRKQLFFDYCSWLFPILERFVEQTDISLYSRESLRTPGHLSERLFNIWYAHQERTCDWKTRQLQCVHFTSPDRAEPLGVETGPDGCGALIPVVLAADNNYVPMLTTTICSMLENASPGFYYDVIVFEKNIDYLHKGRMIDFFSRHDNVKIRFYNVSRAVEGLRLSTSNPHISGETYYRFLIQELLPFYSKVLYLDSDLIIQGDIAKLYATELGDNLLAAAPDIDFLANLNIQDGKRLEYAKEVLGMKDPYSYFQAGVLLINTAAMRRLHSFEEWIEFASDPGFIYNDQDALNSQCEGRVVSLDQSWNVMHNCGGRVDWLFPQAPCEIYERFCAARSHEKIIHYAGVDKPWSVENCDRAEEYWRYARKTPFYEKLISRMATEIAQRNIPDPPPPPPPPQSLARKAIEVSLPAGTRRRAAASAAKKAVFGKGGA